MAARKVFPLSIVIGAVDRVTAPMRAIQKSVVQFDKNITSRFRKAGESLGLPVLTTASRRFGSALGDLGGRATKAAGAITAIFTAAGGLGLLAVKGLVDTASEFERYNTILETIEGSSEKASAAMAWISDFAATTPFELAQVTDNFVKLRAYGIDPMQGTLRSLGDTAAAMGKPLEQAVEALADAVTGENERLKEFGIRASKTGGRIVYEYSMNGRTMRKSAEASNRAMIESVLTGIWNEKYGGAMDKLSGTWAGMLSNLADQWARFKLMIMQSGAFDALRNQLSATLEKINRMAESGVLKQVADEIGHRLMGVIEALPPKINVLMSAVRALKDKLAPLLTAVTWLVDTFGGANVTIGVVAAALTLYLVPALYATVVAFKAFGIAIAATPLGWFLAAIAAIAAMAYLIYRHWTPIKAFFMGVWESLQDGFTAFLHGLRTLWETLNPVTLIVRAFTELLPMLRRLVVPLVHWAKTTFGQLVPEWAQSLLGGGRLNVAHAGAPSVGAATLGASAAGVQNGRVSVDVNLHNLPPGTRVQTEQRGDPAFELNQGFQFGAG